MTDNMILLLGVGVLVLLALWLFRRIVPFFKYFVIFVIAAMALTLYQNGQWPWQ